ncbi:MAG TPA: serine/threonine-protein kinase [Nitriliruptoraceae bacterium]|nr:serine/threonine-protein kinase [Nitriliruptoraceae bacterium]
MADATQLGDWVVEDPIGHGTGTVVHRGHHRLHPDRLVAIKRLRGDGPAGGGGVADLRATLEREAQVLASLAHPSIMPFSDVVMDGDGVALVMPLAAGGSLAARIRAEGALPWRDVADLGARVAAALAAAHGAGIVHRDVTPGNILFGRELEPRLADFGAALLASDDGRLIGTPGYLDPMVTRGTPPGPSGDVYSLGVVLYEALAGQPPFAGATPEATMRAADRGIHLPLAALAPDAPGNLAAIIEQAMQRDAAGRFSSAQQLQVALEHVLLSASGEGSVTMPPPLPPPPWASAAPGADAPVDASAPPGAAARPDATGVTEAGTPRQHAADGAPARSGDADSGVAGGVVDAGAEGGGAGSVDERRPAPATTDFGPRPMQPLDVAEPTRPWWMVAALVAVVAIPLVVAVWAVVASRSGDVAPTAATTSATSPTTASTVAVSPSASPGGLAPRVPAPLCAGEPTPGDGDLVADVDDRGCSLVITVTARSSATILTLPAAAGSLAGTYSLDGPPEAVVVGDWDGDGIDTPAVTLDASGAVWAFPEWDAGQSEQIGEPIGDARPVVRTDDAGIDHVAADEGA